MNKVDIIDDIDALYKEESMNSENSGEILAEDMFTDFVEKAVAYGHKTPPKGFPENRSDYADPENYKYPLDTAERVMAAFRYYNQAGQREAGGYTTAQWASIGRRIITALNRLSETDYTMESGKIARKDIGGNMDLQKNIVDDTVDGVQTLSETTKIGLISKFITWINGDNNDITKSIEVEEAVQANNVSSAMQPAPSVNIYINKNGDVDKSVESTSDDVAEITKAMECPECGASVPEGEDSCSECGCDMGGEVEEGNMKKSDTTDETLTEGEDNGGNEVDVEKLMEGFGALLDERINKIKEEVLESVDEKLTEVTKSIDEKVETVSERVETVENAGAIKKSVDEEVVGDEEIIEKKAESFWGGIFVPAEIAEVLGYES
jgi:hypothetical protein